MSLTFPTMAFHNVKSISFSPIRVSPRERKDPFIARDLIIIGKSAGGYQEIFKITFFGRFSADLVVAGDSKPPLIDAANDTDQAAKTSFFEIVKGVST